jgi:hypothetical protein
MADQASPATQQPPIVETWRLALAVAPLKRAAQHRAIHIHTQLENVNTPAAPT